MSNMRLAWALISCLACSVGFLPGRAFAQTSGLVAAYSFDEGTGTTIGDTSGNGNSGTITNATWTATGKYGKALSFDGTNAIVHINDSPSLRLTTAMTLEAWVNPATVDRALRDVVMKGNEDYFLQATSNRNSRPAGGGSFINNPVFGTAALPVNTWTHLAVTYDKVTLRLYVNGV